MLQQFLFCIFQACRINKVIMTIMTLYSHMYMSKYALHTFVQYGDEKQLQITYTSPKNTFEGEKMSYFASCLLFHCRHF